MNRILFQYLKTPVGELILGDFRGSLCLCDWRDRRAREAVDRRLSQGLKADFEEGPSPLFSRVEEQLGEYFSGERRAFELPLRLVGTPFQQEVWSALGRIPFGQTATYSELARDLGRERAVRAVAAANGANGLSIVVPCHRVIGRDGTLTGYAGGLDAKRRLLELEGSAGSQ